MKIRVFLILALFLAPFALGQMWEATRIGNHQWELVSDDGKHISWHQSEAEAVEKGQSWSLDHGLRSYQTRHTGTRWESTAFAQMHIAGEVPITISSLTAGNEVSVLNDAQTNNAPSPGNRIYTDITTGWFDSDTVPSGFDQITMIRTQDSDRGSTGASLIAFTLSAESQVCIWHSAGITSKPSWLASEGYVINNNELGVTSPNFGDFIAYCALQSGATTLGGNTSDGDDTFPMYFVTVAGSAFQQPVATAPSASAGEYSFLASSDTVAESTSQDVACVQRLNGTNGAVSIDVTEGAGSTCTTEDSWSDPTTISWADTVSGSGGCVALTAGAVSGDCTVDFEFVTAVGGISAGASNQTTITTIQDTPAAGTTFYVGKDGSDANSCATAQTIGTPKLTISAGIACLSAGETLAVKTGTYTEAAHGNDIPNGTSWNDVTTVTNNASDVVTLRRASGESYIFFFGGHQTNNIKQYIEVSGFIMDGLGVVTDDYKVEGPSHHMRLSNNELKNATNQGALFSTPNGWPESVGGHEVLDNIFHDNGDDPLEHGLYFTPDNSKVWGNIAYNNAGYGFHLWHSFGLVNGNDVQYNTAYDNSKFGLLVRGGGNLIANNIAYQNTNGGLSLFGNSDANKVYNNTVTDYAGGKGIRLGPSADNNLITNNIFWGTGTDIDDGNGGTGNTKTTNFTSDPSFLNEGTRDLRIPDSSGACDSGTTVAEVTDDFLKTARPQETNYAIGAYECVGL